MTNFYNDITTKELNQWIAVGEDNMNNGVYKERETQNRDRIDSYKALVQQRQV